ncbi:hypothetical protein VPNG_01489 [Cytospora leucostoma]|uniref:Ketoreductase (KR) domain-containing protein n=1 Tax=Cytospora leucostoma TaxID=1230097 RepID=A0A423XK30_9PEZI|nr:hypothetical protein VPNG_01489 [Cytospora leucostoma]
MAYKGSVIVTGGTVSLGYNAAKQIAREHPDYLVVISSRSDRNNSAEAINKSLGQNNTVFQSLDLFDLDNIRDFANQWAAKNNPPIKALLLNAGLQFTELQRTPSGLEKTFAVCHVGHVLLFHLLLPFLAQDARVVVTASGTHDPAQKTGMPDAVYTSAEEIARPTALTEKNPGPQRYTTTKLCNILWTYGLSKRLGQRVPERGITVNAFDPGLMPGTGLAREYGCFLRFIWNKVLPRTIPLLRLVVSPNIHTPEESGASLARLATAADVRGINGKYYEGDKEIPSSKDSYDESKQDDLWSWTINYLANGDQEEIARLESLK